MVSNLYSLGDLRRILGARSKERRLALGLRQQDLAISSGVPSRSVRRFEAGGSIGLEAVLKIAMALGAENDFAALFPQPERQSLDDILRAQHRRSRVRKRS